MAALLYGDWPSKRRVAVGVAAVLVAWSGIITSQAVTGFMAGLKQRREFQQMTTAGPGSVFEDTKLGLNLRLPDGWSILSKENALVEIPEATFVAVHEESGCIAALLVEPRIIEPGSLDEYLNLVLTNRQTAIPSMTETGRSDLDFGGNAGRRLETFWNDGDKKFRGFTTCCQAGWSYYLLAGWCVNDAYSNAFADFQSLERAFQITGTTTLLLEDEEPVDAEPEIANPESKPARKTQPPRR
jgi:hypothetical protein